MIECMRNASKTDKNDRIKDSVARWIPVSERLPEEIDKYYLVTCRSVFCGEFEQFTTVSYFSTFSNGDKSWEIEEEHGNNWMVTAWQPLPKPYKEGER